MKHDDLYIEDLDRTDDNVNVNVIITLYFIDPIYKWIPFFISKNIIGIMLPAFKITNKNPIKLNGITISALCKLRHHYVFPINSGRFKKYSAILKRVIFPAESDGFTGEIIDESAILRFDIYLKTAIECELLALEIKEKECAVSFIDLNKTVDWEAIRRYV